MDRHARVSVVAAVLLMLGVATVADAQQQQPAVPPPCPPGLGGGDAKAITDKTLSRIVRVSVGRNGAVQFPNLKIGKGRTRVIWFGEAGVADLFISFKKCLDADQNMLENPDCNDGVCILDKAKHKDIVGDACYTVVVINEDKSAAVCDPKLIINP